MRVYKKDNIVLFVSEEAVQEETVSLKEYLEAFGSKLKDELIEQAVGYLRHDPARGNGLSQKFFEYIQCFAFKTGLQGLAVLYAHGGCADGQWYY